MIKLDVWLDKLPEDKAKYYNRTRMSMEFFAQKLGTSRQDIIEDFRRNGYVYNESERVISLAVSRPKFPKSITTMYTQRASEQ